MASEKVIGIDLGTTNSCVAIMEGGEPVVIQNAEGQRTTPSIVGFTDKGEQLVGQTAKNQIITNPTNTLRSIKRFMGSRYSDVKNETSMISYDLVEGSGGSTKVKTSKGEFSPQEISAKILQKMKQTAEDFLGQEIKKAVVTVPAYFNDEQRQATKDAGKIAGLEVDRIINEPTAAALAYGLDKTNKEQKIAVYDLGGGTFDISILELGDGVFEVKSTNGDTHLGGDDFDERVIQFLIDEFKKQSGMDISSDKMAIQRLKEAAERAKIELSSKATTDINIPFLTADQNGPKHLNISLSKAQFEDMVSDLVERTRIPCENAIRDAGIAASEIDEVILVGGSTRMPAVQELVKKIFGKEPSKSVNPDEVVAIGAAIQGGILAGDVNDVLLLDVTPLSLGIETLGGVMTKLIPRNTTIPNKKNQVFSTAADNQPAVSINVLQGEREMASVNRVLGRFDLVGIPPAPRGVPQIDVIFDIDANGIVHVSAKDLGTGKEQKIKIESSSGLSEDEINKMVNEAKENEEADKKLREINETRNQADTLIYGLEKTMKDNADDIQEDEKTAITAAMDDLKKTMESDDIEAMKADIEKLNQASHKFAERIYSKAQADQAGAAGAAGAPGADPGAAGFQGANPAGDAAANPQAANDEKVVDAEFEVVDDEEKK